MSQDRLTGVPDFAIGKTAFQCWTTDGGHRLEWRSTDGLITVGRNPGSSTCWAKVRGSHIGREFCSLKEAMIAALGGKTRRVA